MVGKHGTGESIWLGFFQYDVLTQFATLAHLRGDLSFAERCRQEAADLRQNIELHGWDGAWYSRAYFDDGSPLGSATNPECQIDSVAQSWSVLSGAGDALRSRTAMDAVDRRLVRRDSALIQLLDPPFDKSDVESRLHQRIRAGGTRKWRAVYACGHLGGNGVRRIGRATTRMGTVDHDQPGQPCEISGRRPRPTRSNRMSSRPTSMRSRRTPAAVDGRGTLAQPAGCTGSSSNHSSG